MMYQLKFYADCPDNGPRNKLFAYPVHDGKHVCDLLARFLAKGYRLRAAFLGDPGQLGQQIPDFVVKLPGSIATASTMLTKYPSRSAQPLTTADLAVLMDTYPELRNNPGLAALVGRTR
jgi:hypothetical protein